MPTYRYICPDGHEHEVWRSIHAETRYHHDCECGQAGTLVLSTEAIVMPRSADRRATVTAINAKEAGWDRDMPAYKRLRDDGLQPQAIDGAAHLETTAEHAMEIESGGIVTGSDRQIRESMELAREITQGVL